MATFTPKEFRVWMIPSVPGEPATVTVTTVNEACIALDTLVAIRENLEKRDLPVWHDDVSGVEFKNEEGEWEEFYDEDGEDFEYYWNLHHDCPEDAHLQQKLADTIGVY